ncbi:MAG: fibrobacter succinogenes major paralogous domain-containing protein [Polyangia bacterium]|nr:fibrobacter succinogenes major paralogous domain-containing protein [Polyangia bacterium]
MSSLEMNAMDYFNKNISFVIGALGMILWVGCDREHPSPKPFCGDQRLDPGEVCDGEELGGQSCLGLGYIGGGSLSCTSDCELDVSGCRDSLCGNGQRDPGETCDQDDLGGATCEGLGYYDGGELACAANCTLDASGCLGGFCGDLIINGPEVCDGPDMSAVTCVVTCEDYGFYGGALSCTDSCTLDPSTCEEFCGDGIINGPEVCDGTELGGDSCDSLGYHGGGDLACASDCLALDLSGCMGGRCGDGEIDSGEECEEGLLGGLTCELLGHVGGEIVCGSDCMLDLSGCHDDLCGDEVRTGAEACDSTDLGGATCEGLGYYGGGELDCMSDCTLDVSGCMGGFCGDGELNGAEACDSSDLGGATCEDFGLASGNLGCDASCQLDTSACLTNWICGDQLVDDRDGQSYPTLAIGGLCWMGANLDVGTRIDTSVQQTNNALIEKYCFQNNQAMCDTYAGLYQWDEAMDYSTADGAPGICPQGWRMPTDQEWKALEIAAGMDPAVADLDQWRGPPAGTVLQVGGTSGFDMLLGGMVSPTGVSYNYPTYGYLWTSTMGYWGPWRRCFTSGPGYPPDTIGRWDTWSRTYALHVRCVTNL